MMIQKSQKSGMMQKKKCRSRQELSNEHLLAKKCFDTYEKKPFTSNCLLLVGCGKACGASKSTKAFEAKYY